MRDPLSEVISLLRPQTPSSKLAAASGPFRVRREDVTEVFYAFVLVGRVCLQLDGKALLEMGAGDFVLVPAARGFTISSVDPPPASGTTSRPVVGEDGVFRIGPVDGPVDVQQLVGHCSFGSADSELLVSLLPDMVVVRGEQRLGALAGLLRDEARADRPARDVIVQHLLEVLLIEAFRASGQPGGSPGLLQGLADARIGPSLRAMHRAPEQAWTVAQLAREAGLSRSAFYTRFNRIFGVPPMGYLLSWRMTLAKHLLAGGGQGVAEVGARAGYGSVSAFSSAFQREVGCSPMRYARTVAAE
ncbi:AraC family transcriptional regulator [Algicella marina]|uniref:Helix-turn-helix domain-containing protein n=1 Tax=Algicella marina TaxID=2683284 RepID=A0A6P1SXN8_9RHOB|nr:AraC family transcriptional regulator [Algicella marina]QHQ33976.1 helix-turn-helix domain-containing protein [Algicella marina]